MIKGRIWLSLVPAAILACGGESGGGGATPELGSLPQFCQDALASVEAFMATGDEGDTPRDGGTVVVGVISDIVDGMNAFATSEHASEQHQIFVNLMTLIRLGEDLSPEPYLAERWELSEDGRELVFFLRDDVVWHDGTPTTAHDVAFTFRRASDPETLFPNSSFWERYEAVEVIDDHTVRFTIEPHLSALNPWRGTAIMPAHLLEDVPPAELRGHPFGTTCPVGNGPFVFSDRAEGDHWTFRANGSFPEALGGRPAVDRYVYRIIPDQNTLMSELMAGSVDIYIQPLNEQAGRIEEADDLSLMTFPFRSYTMVVWNSRRPTLQDKRVRQAITHATDRQQMLQVLKNGYGTIANASVPPFHPHYDSGIEGAMAYNPGRAERLLTEAGWVDRDGDGFREDAAGTPLEISIAYNTGNEERKDIAEIMQAQLGHVGIRVRVESVEFGALLERVLGPSRDFDGVTLAWTSEFNVDDTNLFHSSQSEESYGFAGTSSPELDRLLEAIPNTTSQEALGALLNEYQSVLVDEQPFTFLYYADRTVGVSKRVENVVMDARGEWVGVHDWRIVPAGRRVAANR